MNKKKLAIICTSALSLINFRYELISELNKKFSIDTFSEDKSQNVIKKLKKINVNSYSYGVKKFNFLIKQIISLINLTRLLTFKKYRYDCYFVYTIKAILLCSFLNFNKSKVIFLVTGLGFLFKPNSKNYFLNFFKFTLKILLKLTLKKANLIVFQNKDDKNVFLKKKIIEKDKKVLVMNGSGINIQKFNFQKKIPKKFTVLMISRIIKDKGIETYFNAIQLLRREKFDINFIFCGQIHEGVDKYDINKLKLDVDKLKVKLILNEKNIKKIIKSSSVVVLPSPYREGVPRSLLEAISIGRPVIGTNVPGIKEVIIHSWNGFFIKRKSPKELVKYILKLKNNKRKYDYLRYNSRKLAVKKFEVNKVNNVFLSNI